MSRGSRAGDEIHRPASLTHKSHADWHAQFMALVRVGARLQPLLQMLVVADELALSTADTCVNTTRAGGRTPSKRCHLAAHILWRHISLFATTQVRKF
jgi:hypothetical protein